MVHSITAFPVQMFGIAEVPSLELHRRVLRLVIEVPESLSVFDCFFRQPCQCFVFGVAEVPSVEPYRRVPPPTYRGS